MDILKTISNGTNIVVNCLKIRNLLKKDKNKIDIDKEANKVVNDEIENKNDTSLSDAIRKEKQMKIEALKKMCLFVVFIFLSGCSLFKDPIKTELLQNYDVNSLKTTDKTYRLTTDQNISVYDSGVNTNYYFNIDWFVVHKDLLKTYNENQNYIIEELTKKQNFKEYFIYVCIGIFILFLVIYFFTKLNKK